MKNTNIELFANKRLNNWSTCQWKVYLNNYILPNLRYKDIESCLLIQQNQFIDPYTTLGYLKQ
jgi:hypothetical protein